MGREKMKDVDCTLFWKDTIGVENRDLLDELVKHSTVWKARRRDFVIRESAVVKDVPFLISGVAKAYWKDAAGREKIFCFAFEPGEPMVSIFGIGEDLRAFCTVELVRDSVLIYIPLDVLFEVIGSFPEAAAIYDRMLQTVFRRTIERERIMVTCPARERYVWFREMYPGVEEFIPQKDIASFLNMSPENLNRILRKNVLQEEIK